MKTTLILIFGSLMFISCSNSTLMSNYEDYDFSNQELLIFPIVTESIELNGNEDVNSSNKDTIKKPKELLSDSLYQFFTNIAKKRFKKTKMIFIDDTITNNLSLKDTLIFFDHTLFYDKSSKYDFHFPKKQFLEDSKKKSRFVLVINKLILTTESNLIVNSGPVTSFGNISFGGGINLDGSTKQSFRPYFEFAIWDYNSDELVLFGKQSYSISAMSFNGKIDNLTWNQLFQSVTYQILKNIPFH